MKENVFNNEWWTEESSLWFEKLSDEEAFENIVDRIIGNHGNLSIQVVRAAWNLSTSTHKDQSSRYSKRRVLRHILAAVLQILFLLFLDTTVRIQIRVKLVINVIY
jgi:hypothetical protein